VSGSDTARGALVGIGTVVVERGIAFVVVLVLARTLTPETFGRYGYLLAGMTLVQVMADQGIEVAAVAAMSAAPGRVGEILAATALLRALVWGLVAVPVGWLLLPAFGADGDGRMLAGAGLAASMLVLFGASISMRGVLRARGAMGAMAGVALADAILGGCAVIAAARTGAGLAAIFLARAAASAVVTAAALVVGPHRPPRGGGRGETLGQLARVAAPLGGNALLIAVHTRAGHLVAMMVAGPLVVGLLGVAARLTEVMGVLPEGALLALFPRMAASPSEAAALAADAARRLAAVTLAAIVVLAVGATPLVTGLFGEAYSAAGPAVAILAWIALLAVTGGVTLHALVARGAERTLLPANLIAAAAGVGMQVVLIRAFGLAGAAAATVATAALGQIALAVSSAARPVVVAVWRAVAPLVVLAGVAVVGGRLAAPTIAGAIAASAGYMAIAAAFGLIGADDWQALRRALVRPSSG
jgi:O-antigen/teichoic acid export membrane protein